MKERIITAVIICAFLLGCINVTESRVCASDKMPDKETFTKELKKLPVVKEDLSKKQKSMIKNFSTGSIDDVTDSAAYINMITDSEAYDVAIHEILDSIYDIDDNESIDIMVSKFTEVADDRAQEIINDYEEARKERNSADELDYVTGEVLVLFESGTSEEYVRAISERMGTGYQILSEINIDYTLPQADIDRLEAFLEQELPVIAYMDIGLDKTVNKANQMLEQVSCVSDASPNYCCNDIDSVESEFGINDSYANNQHGLLQSCFHIAWDSWRDADDIAYTPVKVAVIDTGIDITHDDLKNVYTSDSARSYHGDDGYFITPMTVDNCYSDNATDANHGSAVSGVIAAQSNNNSAIAGAAAIFNDKKSYNYNNCSILAINAAYDVYNKEGKIVSVFSDACLIDSIYYAIGQGARVINMSLGGLDYNISFQQAINTASNAGIVVCAAAGNENKYCTNYYPAAYNNVIAVSALTSDNSLAVYSNYGEYVDIAALGDGVYSLNATGKDGGGDCDFFSGTSMATPFVSATAAILISMNPSLTPAGVEYILTQSAYDLYSAGKDIFTGYGMLNAGLAVHYNKSLLMSNAQVTNIAPYRVGNNSVRIVWTGARWAEEYQVCRSNSINGTYYNIKTIQGSDSGTYGAGREEGTNLLKWNYTESGLSSGTYYYKIGYSYAYGMGRNYRYSDAVSITIP